MISLSSTENETASPLRAVPERSIESLDPHNNYLVTAAAPCSCGTPASFLFFRNVIISRSRRRRVSTRLIFRGLAHCQEIVTTGFVFLNPLLANWPD